MSFFMQILMKNTKKNMFFRFQIQISSIKEVLGLDQSLNCQNHLKRTKLKIFFYFFKLNLQIEYNYRQMSKMNKFYKTSYSKRVENNFHNPVNSNEDQTMIKQLVKRQKGSVQFKRDNLKNKRLHEVIENKIEIDPTLLFSHKNNISRNSNYEKQAEKKPQFNKHRMNQTSKQRFYDRNQRPQSKKQSRVRVWGKQRNSVEKNQVKQIVERPKTSKCQRRIVQTPQTHAIEQQCNWRILLNSQQKKQKARPHSTSGLDNRKSQLQTSLDPDFLNLFAN